MLPSNPFSVVGIERLLANPQVRHHFSELTINEMAQSIRELGILQPILVRPEGELLAIVDGERRYRGAKQAGLTTVPVIIESNSLGTAEILHRQLVANCQREDLSPLDKARAIAQLMKAGGWSHTEVAAKLGMPNAAVTRSLAILYLPQPIRELVNSGQIPASAAYELARIKDPQQQTELADRLVSRNLTRDALAGLVKAQRKAPSPGKQARAKRIVATLGSGRSITVTGESLDLDQFIRSLEELLSKSRRARTRGIELGTFLKTLKQQAVSPELPAAE